MRIFAKRPFNSERCLLEKRCETFRARFEIGKVIKNQTFPVLARYNLNLISIFNKLKKIYHKTSVAIANLSAVFLLLHSSR